MHQVQEVMSFLIFNLKVLRFHKDKKSHLGPAEYAVILENITTVKPLI